VVIEVFKYLYTWNYNEIIQKIYTYNCKFEVVKCEDNTTIAYLTKFNLGSYLNILDHIPIYDILIYLDRIVYT